jgi:hypothetical protein
MMWNGRSAMGSDTALTPTLARSNFIVAAFCVPLVRISAVEAEGLKC